MNVLRAIKDVAIFVVSIGLPLALHALMDKAPEDDDGPGPAKGD